MSGALVFLYQDIMVKENRDMGPRVNAIESTMASRLRDFFRMSTSIFHGSKVGEDTKEFLDGVY